MLAVKPKSYPSKCTIIQFFGKKINYLLFCKIIIGYLTIKYHENVFNYFWKGN